MKALNWNSSEAEFFLIRKIADRVIENIDDEVDFLALTMDLEATHCNGCPLDLEALLNADDFNFYHDVYGISRHLNRSTGELMNCFLPRFALKEIKVLEEAV